MLNSTEGHRKKLKKKNPPPPSSKSKSYTKFKKRGGGHVCLRIVKNPIEKEKG